jgi:hypothetical protein
MKKSSVRSKELSCRIVKARAVRDEAAERDGILRNHPKTLRGRAGVM